jgi:hypothetical protein
MANKEQTNFSFRLENKSRANGYFLFFILSGIVFTGIAFYLISQESAIPLIIEVLAAILFFITLTKIKPTYIEFMVFPGHFTFNYYPVATVSRDYQSVDVPINEFSHFSIIHSFFGFRKELIISVTTRYGIADYPPISLSILKEEEIKRMVHVLQKLKPDQKREDSPHGLKKE